MGCTTGAKILDDGRSVIIFKNKDFRVKNHCDTIWMKNPHLFGVLGVNLSTQEMAGFSIGVNQYGLVAVNSNVLTTTDHPYDLITKRIVMEARTIDDAVNICEQEVEGDENYQWCNMIVATPKKLAAFEITSSDLAITHSNDYLVRTNHHLILETNDMIRDSNHHKGQQEIKNSETRYMSAENHLRTVSDKQEIFSLLKSHSQESAICRHGRSEDLLFTTVYSYIVTVSFQKTVRIFHDVAKGPPCRNSYQHIELNFPLDEGMKKQISENYPF